MAITKELYITRISNATSSELVVISYELVIEHMTNAINLSDNQQVFKYSLKKAADFLSNLLDSLDMQYEISRNLASIYIYVNKLLIQAKLEDNPKAVQEAKEIFTSLLSSWKEVAKHQEGDSPLMNASQKVYAGLTYGKGELREYIDENCSRGYRA